MTEAASAWEELARRAAASGFAGVASDTDDELGSDDLREGQINPNASGAKKSGAGGGGMMPPMMGGAGGGAGGKAAAAGGLGGGGGTAPIGVDASGALGGSALRAGSLPGAASAGGLGAPGATGVPLGGGPGASSGPMAAAAGTPTMVDTDGDGIPDTPMIDTDGDGIPDTPVGSGRDSDGDGVSDFEEWANSGPDARPGDPDPLRDRPESDPTSPTGPTGPDTRVPPDDQVTPRPNDPTIGPPISDPRFPRPDPPDRPTHPDPPTHQPPPTDPDRPTDPTRPTQPVDPTRPPGNETGSDTGGDNGGRTGNNTPGRDDPGTVSIVPRPGESTTNPPRHSQDQPELGGYTVDPEQLRAAARKWSELSDATREASTAPIPTNTGAVPAKSITALAGTVKGQAFSASVEFASIADRLMKAAEGYSDMEQWNANQAQGMTETP